MAFVKKTWVDRVSEYPNRRVLIDTTTSVEQTVTVSRSEGTVSQIGDAFSAQNMNGLETRIETETNLLAGNISTLSSNTTASINLLNTSVNTISTTRLDGKTIKVLTAEQYAALSPKDTNTLYFIPEA